ncbi:chitosanase [Polluticoccus soli]|uniref:chitosanase n=1 Tax=Polluticoccus soli TaxID=3034150 RepID=UPI0023E1ED3A|nr:chitosanase [Flavipsychrobacter sp. JY13-12]
MITPAIKNKIEKVINAFETGRADGNYAGLVKYRDYRDPATRIYITQITYGRSQTTEFGNLKPLIQNYVNSNGTYAAQLKPYVNRIGRKPSLSTDTVFCNLLIEAAKNDPIMRDAQDQLFDSYYYLPALGWFNAMGFTLPLSLLVIYDSHIHSGSIPDFLRKRFPAVPPVRGGDEKTWIKQYVDTRHEWLRTHPNKILNNTIYRTTCFKKQMQDNNWDLAKPVKANGVLIA